MIQFLIGVIVGIVIGHIATMYDHKGEFKDG